MNCDRHLQSKQLDTGDLFGLYAFQRLEIPHCLKHRYLSQELVWLPGF